MDVDRSSHERSPNEALETERALRAELEDALRLQEEVLHSTTHELRNPLNSIRLWTQVLRERGSDPALTARALAGLEHATALQERQIETLLDAARMAVGRLRIEVEPADLRGVVQRAVESARPMAVTQDVAVDADIGARGKAIRFDVRRLELAVWHLLAHAIRATPRSGRVRVWLERPAGGAARILVSYTPRSRETQPISVRSPRLGVGPDLGLTLARHIVELHGGSMTTTDAAAGGATISIDLPASLQVSAPAGVSASAVNGGKNGDALTLDGVRVLVVEDELEAREGLRLLLQRLGAEVAAAASVREALETLEGATFDVLISDIAMPDADGYALLRAIRALAPERGGRLPAVAVTAGGRPDDRQHALAEGFQAYLPKPVDLLELVRELSALRRP